MSIFKDEQFEFLDKKTRKILMENRESFVPHTPYAYEKHMLDSIRRGDIEQAKYWIEQIDAGKGGKLSENPLRQEQVMFVAFITLITRAALEGSVKEDIAYAMSDTYIQTVGKCTTIPQIKKLKEHALKDFVNAVRNHQQSAPYSKAVRKSIQYMRSHLQEKITIKEMAAAVGLSNSRFSHLFREETGMSPMAYFRMEKIESAREMLKDSNHTVYEIATILGFSSESHFIRVFREQEGITPADYRRR